MDQCPICLERLTKPLILPCLHSFCSACLVPVLEKGQESRCPLCLFPFPSPKEGTLTHLACPAPLASLLLSSTPPSSLPNELDLNHISCEICEEHEAEKGCGRCDQFLCSRCAQFHQKGKLTANHPLLEVEELLGKRQEVKDHPTSKVWRCDLHLDEELKLYCKNCKQATCSICVVQKHQKHDLELISNIAKEFKTRLEDALLPLQNKAMLIEETINKISSNLHQTSDFSTSTVSSINQSFQKLREAIDFREAQLLQTVESTKNVKEKQLRLQQENAEFLKSSLQAALNLSTALVTRASPLEIATGYPMISPRLSTLTSQHFEADPCQAPNMEFSLERVVEFEELIGKVGHVNLSLSTTVASLSRVERDSLVPAVTPDSAYSLKVTSRDSNGEKVESGGDKYVAVLDGPEKPEVIVSDHGNGTYTLTTSSALKTMGKYLMKISLRGEEIQGSPLYFSVAMQRNYQRISAPRLRIGGKGSEAGQFDSPRAVATNSKGEIIVADTTNRRLQIFDKEGTHLFSIGDLQSPRKKEWIINPYGVAIDPLRGDRILVADTDHHRVLVYSQDGSLLFSFGKEGEGEGEFKLPFGVAVNREGEIIVTDQRNHRVQVFDEDGRFLRRFGTYGTEEGELSGPSGVAVDSRGNILVSEHLNFRVQAFDRQGRFLRFIGKGKLKNPYHLAVDPFDRVIVSDFGGSSVLVFDWEDRSLGNFANGIKTTGVWVDGEGKIYVCSRDTHQVLIF